MREGQNHTLRDAMGAMGESGLRAAQSLNRLCENLTGRDLNGNALYECEHCGRQYTGDMHAFCPDDGHCFACDPVHVFQPRSDEPGSPWKCHHGVEQQANTTHCRCDAANDWAIRSNRISVLRHLANNVLRDPVEVDALNWAIKGLLA